MIDWNALAIDDAIQALGRLLVEEHGLWVGFVSEEGEQTAIGQSSARPRPLLLCERLIANGIRRPDDSTTTCRASIASWATRDSEGSRLESVKVCHVGLGAATAPIERAGRPAGSVYAAGFLPSDRASSLLPTVGNHIVTGGAATREELEKLMDSVPLLNKSERRSAVSIVQAIARRASALLGEEKAVVIGDRYGEMIGSAPAMLQLFEMLRKVARTDSTVLIEGEPGTGKELIARALHRHSRRSEHPFVAQNCAAIPAELIESELFGHRKGAFSGAHRDREGLFEAADHGTFFLDEIGEMDISLQVKLLRVLQEGSFLPVGDNRYRKVDVRLVCATNRDLRQLVSTGGFRDDLYYRVNVITVKAPPLRHRRQDIPILATYFLNKASNKHALPRKRLSREAMESLVQHPWPGNVRQLENEVERLVIMSGADEEIGPDALSFQPAPMNTGFVSLAHADLALPEAVERLERQMILESLRRTGWNKTQTAKELGVSRRNLIRKVAQYELEKHRG